tara:strand:- start:8 stop:259 length:252 start_codon:yes stop_codon:yes gene_type:complete
MTVEQVEDVVIEIVTENFKNYSESYAEFLSVLWISIKPNKVYLIYPSGTEIFLESVKTYDKFMDIVQRIERIYCYTEQFCLFE